MALFKSSVLAQVSGSLGGLTFSRNRGGLYLRTRRIPVNPGTEDQQTVRGYFANLASAWANLTAAQRTAWATYAANVPVTNRMGDQINLTGQQMFIRNNAARMRLGLSAVASGPTDFSSATLTLPTTGVNAADSGLTVQFTEADAWVGEDDAALGVYISTDKSPATEYHKGPYLLAGAILGDSVTPPTTPDTSLTSPYVHADGNSVFLRYIVVMADGRISPVMREGPVTVVTT